MQASIKKHGDGTVNLQLDSEAASAVFASVVFASSFHEAIVPLKKFAEEGLHGEFGIPNSKDGSKICQ